MKNYMMINKNKIEISQETADNLEQQFATPSETYSVGDRFRRKFGGSKHILISTAISTVVMGNLKDGCRYGDAVKVSDWNKIPQSEFDCNWGVGDFVRYWDYVKQESC